MSKFPPKRYIVDEHGRKLDVVLSLEEFEDLMARLVTLPDNPLVADAIALECISSHWKRDRTVCTDADSYRVHAKGEVVPKEDRIPLELQGKVSEVDIPGWLEGQAGCKVDVTLHFRHTKPEKYRAQCEAAKYARALGVAVAVDYRSGPNDEWQLHQLLLPRQWRRHAGGKPSKSGEKKLHQAYVTVNRIEGASGRSRNAKSVTQKDAEATLKAHNYRCAECGVGRSLGESKVLEIDHIVPVAKGGTSDLDNLQPLCVDCHRRKTKAENASRNTLS